jgi:HPt (histidine-containing phosphotransfer) domain-containing protein
MFGQAPADDGELDPEMVDQLRTLARAGNSQLLHRLQASFAQDTPARLRALRAAIAAGDSAAVSFNLHTLAGSAANLGATKVVATCRELEDTAARSDPRDLERLLTALEQHAANAQAALTRLAEVG